ncbi:MAG: ATP phosphoribosyltransferase [Phycisphaerae bacterium]|nr:ATP phosphoribosyltransferase [Phycisphaerae bacterium]
MVNKSTDDKLVLGIPKGSLQDSTLDLFARAGYDITLSSRSYFPGIDDDRISPLMFRAQEMSRYVEDGIVDVGLTGYDWIRENNSDVHEVCELVYSKATSRPARWILAVPEESAVQKPEDLDGGIVATELVGVTRRYFEEKGLNVKVEFSWGATEVKARLLDGIVDVTETGSSIKANKLRIIDTLLTSTPRLIANKKAMAVEWKKRKIENIAMLLHGAIAGKQKVGLKMNVPKVALDAVTNLIMRQLPPEKSPTLSPLADDAWVALEIIVEEKIERDLIPDLKRAGASGIITYPLNKVIP